MEAKIKSFGVSASECHPYILQQKWATATSCSGSVQRTVCIFFLFLQMYSLGIELRRILMSDIHSWFSLGSVKERQHNSCHLEQNALLKFWSVMISKDNRQSYNETETMMDLEPSEMFRCFKFSSPSTWAWLSIGRWMLKLMVIKARSNKAELMLLVMW